MAVVVVTGVVVIASVAVSVVVAVRLVALGIAVGIAVGVAGTTVGRIVAVAVACGGVAAVAVPGALVEVTKEVMVVVKSNVGLTRSPNAIWIFKLRRSGTVIVCVPVAPCGTRKVIESGICWRTVAVIGSICATVTFAEPLSATLSCAPTAAVNKIISTPAKSRLNQTGLRILTPFEQ